MLSGIAHLSCGRNRILLVEFSTEIPVAMIGVAYSGKIIFTPARQAASHPQVKRQLGALAAQSAFAVRAVPELIIAGGAERIAAIGAG
jgi:hypothetical protein